jgi:hypothetical protein
MAESHVLSALRTKRAELSGVIQRIERQLAGHRGSLSNIDATILLFDVEAKPSGIKPKAARERNAWFGHGECSRAIYGVLRSASEPMTARQITDRIMADRGIPGDGRNVELVGKTVLGSLGRLQGLGRMEVGRAVAWRIR